MNHEILMATIFYAKWQLNRSLLAAKPKITIELFINQEKGRVPNNTGIVQSEYLEGEYI